MLADEMITYHGHIRVAVTLAIGSMDGCAFDGSAPEVCAAAVSAITA